MSHPPASTCQPATSLRTDSLADSVLILLSLAVVQRMVGFCRTVLFCRWLDAEQLGQWDMAFGFLTLVAPVAVLGISGSFGRYAEHYRQLRQLRVFLRRTSAFCAILALLAALTLCLGRRELSRVVFGTTSCSQMVPLLASGLLALVLSNYLLDLFTALRNMRVVALMQLVISVSFAALGITLISTWRATASSVVIAYIAASLIGGCLALGCLRRPWQQLPDAATAPGHLALWSKLAPFAAWVWVGNLLVNLFLVADRYMIIHFSGASAEAALVMVGHYHSALVLPLLLVAVADMLGAMVMPHLSHDWEAGRKEQVSARLNLLLKLFGLALVAASVLALLIAPPLFRIGFQGKFSGGLSVLPWTLTYCVWFGMLLIAENYLYCAEKVRLVSLAILVGLIANVVLNLILLPRLGLLGAVIATTAANLVALVLVCTFNRLLGFRMHRGTWIVLALPPIVCLGPWVSASVLAFVLFKAVTSDWLFTRQEKRELVDGWRNYVARFQRVRMGMKSSQSG